MNFFESSIVQQNKEHMLVCGDTVRCRRTSEYTILILCDGVGSGVYANIAAITCADRLMELCTSDMGFREACSTVADSMHRARTEDIPFAAFSAVKILPDGYVTAYVYESPEPVIMRRGEAAVMEPERFLNAGYEIIGEFFGQLELGDSILIFSDGVSQAGLGSGITFGIGSEGVVKYINNANIRGSERMLRCILEMTKDVSGSRCKDDTTLALMTCREAKQLTIATGPPQQRVRDGEYVRTFIERPGVHVVCGSTTADIVARQLRRELQYEKPSTAFGAPPEYHIEGVDMTTEGAMMLNQVYNILDEPPENLTGDSPVERLCAYIRDADVITFIHGRSVNEAHSDLIFKQIGVRSRQTTIKLLQRKLEEMDKLVITVNF